MPAPRVRRRRPRRVRQPTTVVPICSPDPRRTMRPPTGAFASCPSSFSGSPQPPVVDVGAQSGGAVCYGASRLTAQVLEQLGHELVAIAAVDRAHRLDDLAG